MKICGTLEFTEALWKNKFQIFGPTENVSFIKYLFNLITLGIATASDNCHFQNFFDCLCRMFKIDDIQIS